MCGSSSPDGPPSGPLPQVIGALHTNVQRTAVTKRESRLIDRLECDNKFLSDGKTKHDSRNAVCLLVIANGQTQNFVTLN